MESSIQRQLWEIASGLAAGGGLGLLYELARPLFELRIPALRWASQILYLVIAFAWIFLAGQLGGRGAAPLYLFVCIIGWLLAYLLVGSFRRILRLCSTKFVENCRIS